MGTKKLNKTKNSKRSRMKPIIKWSGGKAQEIKFFEHKIPKEYQRYIEPFAGGAALFFNLESKRNIINDVNFELINLYKILHNKSQRDSFIKHLELLNNQRIKYNEYFLEKYTSNEDISNFINQEYSKEKDLNFPKKLNNLIQDVNLDKLIQKSTKDKIKRVKNIETKENKTFNIEEWREHLTTALQSALYFYSRDIYNKGYDFNTTNTDLINYYIANWYYVREFCYSSMFRFSKNGNFNVPYGGIGYNKKDFTSKINRLKNDDDLHKLLENTDINKKDFEELFKKYNYFNKEDFLFLDPPYDSAFSQYNKEKDFDKNEQIRLRDNLLKIKCKFMVVIKETEFINEIYKDNYFKIEKFDKKYMTNMRNRNDKDVQHLIITNY